jgi:hypothetical protein
MNNYKKYLKYKSKYLLEAKNMIGGDIEEISRLVYEDVPMINDTELLLDNILSVGLIRMRTEESITFFDYKSKEEKTISIHVSWRPYIKFDEPIQFHTSFRVNISFRSVVPNQLNSRGQRLIFLAALNCNKKMIDALVAMGINIAAKNSCDGSSIFHGIAWGKNKSSGEPQKTYREKVDLIQHSVRSENKNILLDVNSKNETFFDNLIARHPNKV